MVELGVGVDKSGVGVDKFGVGVEFEWCFLQKYQKVLELDFDSQQEEGSVRYLLVDHPSLRGWGWRRKEKDYC